MSDRRIALGGPLNFRDLGGYVGAGGRRVRWRRVFRSDSLHRLTAGDGRRLHDLGVATAIDFRAHDELDRIGIGPLGELHVRHVHLPTVDRALRLPEGAIAPGRSAADVYAGMLEHGRACFVEALRVLAEPGALPAVYFCMAGKDRTGLFSALLLGVLGVGDDDVVADYVLTDEVIDAIHARSRAERPGIETVWERIPADLAGAHAATMEGLLARVRGSDGSLADWARGAGVDAAVVERLRAALLEDSPEPGSRPPRPASEDRAQPEVVA